jgi:hypothetical protein
MYRRISRVAALASATALCTLGVVASPAEAVMAGSVFDVPGDYTCSVPEGVTSTAFVVRGGNGGVGTGSSGGGVGGRGAELSGLLAVTPGQVLLVTVGGNGMDGDPDLSTGGGGGGYSSIATDGGPLVVAGGGGGGGYSDNSALGGDGGVSGSAGGGDGGDGGLPGAAGETTSDGGVGAYFEGDRVGGNGGNSGNGGGDALGDDAGGGGGGYGGAGGLGFGYDEFVEGSWSAGGFSSGGDGGYEGGGGGGGYGGGGGGASEGGGGGGSSLIPLGSGANVVDGLGNVSLGLVCVGGGLVAHNPPPSWYPGSGRAADGTCLEGWAASWEQWPNGGNGGFVCSRVIFWDVTTGSWSGNGSTGLPGGTSTAH